MNNFFKHKKKMLLVLVILLASTYIVFAVGSAYRFFGFYSDTENETHLEQNVRNYLIQEGFANSDIVEINAFWNEKTVNFEAYVVFSKDPNRKFYFYEHDGVISTDCDFSEVYLKRPC